MSVLVNNNVGALVASACDNLDGQRDDQIGDVLDPVSASLAVLLCRLCLLNCFALAFCLPVCGGFVFFFYIASTDRAL